MRNVERGQSRMRNVERGQSRMRNVERGQSGMRNVERGQSGMRDDLEIRRPEAGRFWNPEVFLPAAWGA
jgi:hypothetical protein